MKVILASVVITAIVTLALTFRDYSSKGSYTQVTGLKWGTDALAVLQPEGTFYAEVHYYPWHDKHFAQIFGWCRSLSIEQLIGRFDLKSGTGIANAYNSQLTEFVPAEIREDFKFSDTDLDFSGAINFERDGRILVQGAYNSSTGRFFITLTQ